jgi:hypothetical protein
MHYLLLYFLLCFVCLAIGLLGCSSGALQTKPPTYGPYQNVYLSCFENLAYISPKSIRSVGLKTIYPVSIEKVWEACLDVIAQSDAAGHISEIYYIAVFSEGCFIKKKGESASDEMQYYDVMFALCLEKCETNSTYLYLSWLKPDTLTPTAVDVVDSNEIEHLPEFSDQEIRQILSGILADSFFTHLSSQLTCEQRWGTKFTPKK